MDNYGRSMLTVIALLMFGILFKDQFITSAYAAMDIGDFQMVSSRLSDIASAIRSCN